MKNIFIIYCVWIFLLPTILIGQTFYRTIGHPKLNEGGVSICGSPDGSLFVGGFVNDSAMVMKVNQLGEVIWKRTFTPGPNGNDMVNSLSISPDGFLIGTGNSLTSIFSDGFYFKMDLNGNLIWSHREKHRESLYFTNIVALSANEYLLGGAYYYPNGSWADPATFRLDADKGTLLSPTRKHNLAPIPYLDDVYSTNVLLSKSAYQIGRTYLNGADATKMRPFLIKYDADQTPIWAKYYLYPERASARLYGISTQFDGDSIACFYFGDHLGASSEYSIGVFKTDTNGVISWAKEYNILGSSSDIFYHTAKVEDGYILFGYTSNRDGNDLFLVNIDKTGKFQWAKTYGSPSLNEKSQNLGKGLCNHLNSLWFVGTEYGKYSNLILVRTDYSGNINCASGTNIQVETIAYKPIEKTLMITSHTDPITWSDVVSKSSTMESDCPIMVNLGIDKKMASTPIELNAGIGNGLKYLWSDNSTGSNLSVTQPGIYWVQVSLDCCTVSDTIEVLKDNGMIEFEPEK